MSAQRAWAILVAALVLSTTALSANSSSIPNSQGVYRLPYADGTQVKVFADFITHTPRGRLDLYAVGEEEIHRVVASAAGRVVAIQDSYSEQQDGHMAAVCHNNYVWIAHPNGEWTNYCHFAKDSVTKKAGLKVGDEANAGQYIGDEGAVGCAMFDHVHFEVAIPDKEHPIDSGGFLTDNDNGKRELNPRFCGVPGQNAFEDQTYVAVPCRPSNATGVWDDPSPHRTSQSWPRNTWTSGRGNGSNGQLPRQQAAHVFPAILACLIFLLDRISERPWEKLQRLSSKVVFSKGCKRV